MATLNYCSTRVQTVRMGHPLGRWKDESRCGCIWLSVATMVGSFNPTTYRIVVDSAEEEEEEEEEGGGRSPEWEGNCCFLVSTKRRWFVLSSIAAQHFWAG